jgi:membrane fusion protein (multidrug efflux system)
MKSTFFSASLAVILSACSSGEKAGTPSEAPSVPVTTISTSATTTYNEYPATIEGEADVEIRPQVDGILEKIYVDEGTYVTAGQPLFKIQDQVYREQLNNANADLLATQAAVANAQLEIEKIAPLVQHKVVTELQLKTVQSNLNMAVAREKQAQAKVANAKINIGYTMIKAPANGYISRLNKKTGSVLAISDIQELTTLSNIHQVHVYFSLSEKEFSVLKQELPGNTIEEKLRKAPPVSLTLAGDQAYTQPGRLDMVNGAFNRTTGAITIRASFPNTQGLLRSGNTGKIRLQFARTGVITVPQAATMEIQDKIFVYTVGDSSKVHKKAITISGTSGNNYLISEGLRNGEKIVMEGMETLQEGMTVRAATAPMAQVK